MAVILAKKIGVDGPRLKRGSQAMAFGVDNVSVGFVSDFLDINYIVLVTLENVTDLPASIYSYMVTDKRADGFTVSFSGDIDSENYKLNWTAQKIN